MKKLLLTSVFAFVTEEFSKILPKSPTELTVAFVPTASDLSEDPWYMVADRKLLVDMGFKVIDLSLKGKTKAEVKTILDQADIIFVGGGNTFYLLDEANKSGFTQLVPEYVKQGVIYVGGSAGSYIACPTIEAAGWKHADRNIPNLTDLTAINLIPFILTAHYEEELRDVLKTEIENCKFPVKILNDNQAILVIDDSYTLVGDTTEIKL